MQQRKLWIGLLVFVNLVGCATTSDSEVPTEALINAESAKAYQDVKTKSKFSNNRQWNDIVQRVAKRIAIASGENFQWEAVLIENPEPNAWCMPGGKIAVYTGIIPILKTEAALAAVLLASQSALPCRADDETSQINAVLALYDETQFETAKKLCDKLLAGHPKSLTALVYFIRHTQRVGVEVNVQARQWPFEQNLAREVFNFVVHETGQQLSFEYRGSLIAVAGDNFDFFAVFNHWQFGQAKRARHAACRLFIHHLAAFVAAGETGQSATAIC